MSNISVGEPFDDHYSCATCQKKFRKEGFLHRHIRTYNHMARDEFDLKIMKCSVCGCFRPAAELALQTNSSLKCASCQLLTGAVSSMSSELKLIDHRFHQPEPFYMASVGTDIHKTLTTLGVMAPLHPPPHSLPPPLPPPPPPQLPLQPHTQQLTQPHTQLHQPQSTVDVKKEESQKKTKNFTKMYPCPECEKTFSHASSLGLHKKVHTGDFRYMCEFCDKTFFLSEYYNKHRRVHTKEKPYECVFCGKCFSQSNTLTQHKRIHTGEKPYSCQVCGKLFSVKDYLNKHMRTHTGEKPYICKVCGKRYSQQSGMKMHQKAKGHLSPPL